MSIKKIEYTYIPENGGTIGGEKAVDYSIKTRGYFTSQRNFVDDAVYNIYRNIWDKNKLRFVKPGQFAKNSGENEDIWGSWNDTGNDWQVFDTMYYDMNYNMHFNNNLAMSGYANGFGGFDANPGNHVVNDGCCDGDCDNCCDGDMDCGDCEDCVIF